jgi:hypothetical protein
VRDHIGQALAYIYFESAAKLWRAMRRAGIAANIAKLPEWLSRRSED